MDRLYCWNCGILLDDDPLRCSRCGTDFAAGGRAIYDGATGQPLDFGPPVETHCWACNAVIGQNDATCPTCGTDLLDRGHAAVRYDVITRATRDKALTREVPPARSGDDVFAAATSPPAASNPVPGDMPPPAATASPEAGTTLPAAESLSPAKYYCWHCGLPLDEAPAIRGGRGFRCPRCLVDLNDEAVAPHNFDPATGASVGPVAAPPAPPPSRGSRWNLIRRHWRGELPLGVSFWLLYVLPVVIATSAALVLVELLPPTRRPIWVFVGVIATWAAYILFNVWALVGVWRSAMRRRRRRWQLGRGAGWAVTALVLVAQGWLGLASNVLQEFVWQVDVGIDIAFRGDPDVGPVEVAIDREGHAIIIDGGIKFGLAEALEEALAAAPDTEVLAISSYGGRLAPVDEIIRLIREHGLATYTNGVCASACTLIFAAGRERIVGPEAVLAYHAASNGYSRLVSISGSEYMRRTMVEAGIDREAAEQWTRSLEFTVPPLRTLERTNAITGVELLPRRYRGTTEARL